MIPLSAMTASTSTGSATTPQPRLVKAAHEFEAQMMKELIKPMNSGDALTGEDDDSSSGNALGEYASEALGRALSEQGGLGLATHIVKTLSH